LLELLRARYLAARAEGAARFVAGVAGSVAVGKSTFAHMLRDEMAAWPERPRVQEVPTDGFLYPNRVLAERNLSLRKGFPDTYDVEALRTALEGIKAGERVTIPRYSHVTYDVDAEAQEVIDATDIVVLDGLHLARVRDGAKDRLIDQLIYLDADEAHIERWFRDRLIPLMQAGRTDPGSFYHLFREMDDAGQLAFAERVWREINRPNLHDHISGDRHGADIVIGKDGDHGIVAIEIRPA
jgi:type I pantothenate kinase